MRGKPTRPFELTKNSGQLLGDIRQMIEEARAGVAVTVNAGLTMLCWRIGIRIEKEVLKGERAEYGQEIVPTLSAQLVPEFGKDFGVRDLFRMIKFAEVFPDKKIVSTLSTQLSWRHFVEIFALKDELQRDFYAEMCRVERWSVRTLRDM
jgi:hypothetical protein